MSQKQGHWNARTSNRSCFIGEFLGRKDMGRWVEPPAAVSFEPSPFREGRREKEMDIRVSHRPPASSTSRIYSRQIPTFLDPRI